MQKLGDAFLGQRKDTMDAIQRLRAKAQAQGNLKSNEQQKVIVENAGATPPPGQPAPAEQPAQQTIIKIEPANPQVVYVPSYNPTVVYGAWPPGLSALLPVPARVRLGRRSDLVRRGYGGRRRRLGRLQLGWRRRRHRREQEQ